MAKAKTNDPEDMGCAFRALSAYFLPSPSSMRESRAVWAHARFIRLRIARLASVSAGQMMMAALGWINREWLLGL
jgi:hypothetical protein